jgi:hypothetical protein
MFKAGIFADSMADRLGLDDDGFIPAIDCIAEFRTQSVSAMLNSYSDSAVAQALRAATDRQAVTVSGKLFNFLKMHERSRNVEDPLELD